MKKLFFYASLVCVSLMWSCSKEYAVPEGETPEWLGESIYAELQSGAHLSGTFTYYLRLIDDLGYADVLSKTGSKTVFPANDDAFNAFFASDNQYGVSSYEQLSEAQKKQLLYSSMLDNALLLGMLPNVSNGTSVTPGKAIKHATNVSVIDSVRTMYISDIPSQGYWNFWDKYKAKGINVVTDATPSPLIHFTYEYMLNNNLTVSGDASDFSIITGQTYNDGDTYIFRNKVIKGDVTCQNGYIHQIDNVLVPPGNLAQVLQQSNNTKIFSHIVDFWSAPFYDASTTLNYNDWATSNGRPTIDSIFQVRYLSEYSQDKVFLRDPTGKSLASNEVLSFDLGWNGYYPANTVSGVDVSIADIGAVLAPSDDAMMDYFNTSGNDLIDLYGRSDLPKTGFTMEQLFEHLNSIHKQKPLLLAKIVNNLLKASFVSNAPSKFTTMTNDAMEDMNMTIGDILIGSDGKYDVKIANNGIIYTLNRVVAPAEFTSVIGPLSLYTELSVINQFAQDHTIGGTPSALGADMYYYLMAMQSTLAFIAPTDVAMGNYLYPNIATLGYDTPEFLQFRYDEDVLGQVHVAVDAYDYDPTSSTATYRNTYKATDYKTQIQDLLNSHTIVMNTGDKFQTSNRHYYVAKNGSGVYLQDDNTVKGGMQIASTYPASTVQKLINKDNGQTVEVDHVIMPTTESVYSILKNTTSMSEFLAFCEGFNDESLMSWMGISANPDTRTKLSAQTLYKVFMPYNNEVDKLENRLDYNVRMLSSADYTLYAPNNTAMSAAYAAGLPTWAQVQALYNEGAGDEDDAKQAKEMVNKMRSFVQYHFQNGSVFADQTVDAGEKLSLCANELGISKRITVSGGGGSLNVKDVAGNVITISSTQTGLVNRFARDMEFDADKKSAKNVLQSAFTVIHEISTPLHFEAGTSY